MELTKEFLKKRFIEYNAKYFNNELRMCKFSVYNTSLEMGMYTYGRIWIAKRPLNMELREWTEELFLETMVHEMIHHYVCQGLKSRPLLSPHGLRFRLKRREIMRKHGLYIETGIFIKRYGVLKRKAAPLTFIERLELVYLVPLNYLLTWIF
jgi:hypothetical protein